MICCSECFRDLEIKAVIEGIGHRGTCPICHSENALIYDSDLDSNETEFEELLESLIGIYVIEAELDESFPEEEKNFLANHLRKDWNLFNKEIEEEGINQILDYIIKSSLNLDENLLSCKVGVPQLHDEAYLEESSIMGNYEWSTFRNYLRNENRFHSRYINLDVLIPLLRDAEIILSKDLKFYRARVSSSNGFTRSEMGAPPPEKATAGRVNSKGISCLYLASKKSTAVKEIRASVYDYVTIATLKLIRPAKVLDLSAIANKSPFYASDKIKFLINKRHLEQIAADVSKPLARSDSDLDYLPTQYISDLAKFLGYDGVRYDSTFDRTTYNVALFDESICKCIYTKTYLVDNAEYTMTPVKRQL